MIGLNSAYKERASLVAQRVKNLSAVWVTSIPSLSLDDPLEKGMSPHSVFLPVEFHGQRSLAGSSPWGLKESEATERLTHTTLRRLLWEHGSLVTQCRMLP